jgi:hypothetical protein
VFFSALPPEIIDAWKDERVLTVLTDDDDDALMTFCRDDGNLIEETLVLPRRTRKKELNFIGILIYGLKE